ncbi:D/L-glyceraldehyde reductase [Penicillium oxalicum]|uniref:D/L-glyceraldehyde reductase n=1 Tax=Penicillium oxalicum TaxID=69781 RepID=UPI0020B6D993|nr:D/L-glyceraldehyde reductase [Penicillium oxalicum]KAI2789281.1 D/L-glyceraldehyde reductase [Penicillium oxalicum]
MSLGKKVTLNTGAQIPQLGFGTWQSAPGEVGEAVYEALKAGYRHLCGGRARWQALTLTRLLGSCNHVRDKRRHRCKCDKSSTVPALPRPSHSPNSGSGRDGGREWKPLESGAQAKQNALECSYQNQREVAAGIKRAFKEVPGLKREDLFIVRGFPLKVMDVDPAFISIVKFACHVWGDSIADHADVLSTGLQTSKLWNNQHRPEVVEASLDACLAELELEYLDLYLVHWPVAFKQGDAYFPRIEGSTVEGGDVVIDDEVSIVDTWKAMTQLPKSKARAVGVSNHTIEHLEAIINGTGVVPAANQIERHPVLQSNDLVEYCQKKGIHITAYSAFGNNVIGAPLLITRPEIKEVAESVAKRTGQEVTGAHVILAWSQVGGHSVIPKSVTPSRIRDNFKEIELTPEEVEKISTLGKDRKRYNTPFPTYKPRWNINIFGEPEEAPATYKVKL